MVDYLYLSPHLDDVVLACGGQIFDHTARGRSVLIVTVTAGDPPGPIESPIVDRLHCTWGLGTDACSVRRDEDARACAELGAELQHWDLPESIYRVHPRTAAPLYRSFRQLFGAPHEADGPLTAELIERLKGLPTSGRVIAPLAVGRHVDHRLTRQAAEVCFGAALAYYEDYPYVETPLALRRALGIRGGWESEVLPLSPAALHAKIDAIALYRSQIESVFRGAPIMKRRVARYVARIGGERLWRRARPADSD